jgi:hypothetical protein
MGLRAGFVLAGLLGLLPVGGWVAWGFAIVALVSLAGGLVLSESAARRGRA